MNKLLILIFSILLFASFTTASTLFKFTFDGGSNEGFTKWEGSGSNENPDYSNNDYRSAGVNGNLVYQDLGINTSQDIILNMTYDFSQGSNWVLTGISNLNSGTTRNNIKSSFQIDATSITLYSGNSAYKTCSGLSSKTTPEVNAIFLSNKTVIIRRDGVIDCEGVFTGTYGLDKFLILYSRTPNDAIDNIIIVDLIISESLESTFEASQVGSLSSSSTSFQNILNVDFNISVNNTPLWFEVTEEISSNVNNEAECRILVDDADTFGSLTTRSNIAGVLGNIDVLTINFTHDEGVVNIKYQCRRSGGGGVITYANSQLIGHILIDEEDRFINHQFNNIVASTSSNILSEVGSYLFTMSNFFVPNTEGVVNNLVINWKASYTNNFGSDELLNSLISINGTNCSAFPRDVNSGSVGSVGGVCNLNNISANATLNISLFASGSNAIFNFSLHNSDFYTHSLEVAGSGNLSGLSISSNIMTKIFNFSGGNTNHPLTNLYVKGGFSVNSSSLTNASFQFRLVNSANQSSSIIMRDVNGNVGVSILQHIFTNVPIGNYQIELWSACGNSDCTLQGGEYVAYITDVTSFLTNDFIVTMNNSYNGSSILDFNVTLSTGVIVTSNSSGQAIITSNFQFDNLTLDITGFFSKTVLLHNTSQDLNVETEQSLINVRANFKGDGRQILVFNATDGVIFGSTTNGTLIIPFNVGTFNLTVDGPDYLPETQQFSVTSLTTNTLLNVSLGNTSLRVAGFNELTGAPITNFNGLLTSFDEFFNELSSTTNGNITYNNFFGNFTLLVSASGFATTQFNISQVSSNFEFNFSLLPGNSINISVFNVSNLQLLTQDATIEMVSSTNTINVNFTGSELLTNIPSGFYLIKVNSNTFDPRNYFVNITATSSQKLNAFLLPTALSDITTITLITEALDPIQDGILSLLRLFNGTQIVVEQGLTDVVGEVRFNMEDDVRYTVLIEAPEFSTREVQIECCNTLRTYTIVLGLEPTIIFDTSTSGVSTLIRPEGSIISNELQQFNFTVSAIGSLNFFGLYTDNFTGGRRLSNITGSPSGGMTSLSLNMTELNISGRTFTITYFYLKEGLEEVLIVRNYFVTDIVVNESNIIQVLTDIGDDLGTIASAFIGTAISITIGVTFITIGAPAITGGIIAIGILGFFAFIGWVSALIYSFIGVMALFIWFLGDRL